MTDPAKGAVKAISAPKRRHVVVHARLTTTDDQSYHPAQVALARVEFHFKAFIPDTLSILEDKMWFDTPDPTEDII